MKNKHVTQLWAALCLLALPRLATAHSPAGPGENPSDVLTVDVVLETDLLCFGALNGLVVVNASGGLAPYTYVWSNGTLGPINANLAAGVYTVTATDFLGATGTLSVTIDQPTQLIADVDLQVNIDCENATGSVTLDVAGGTGPYSVLWSNGQVGLTATGLSAGV
jgi:hypothetical protein